MRGLAYHIKRWWCLPPRTLILTNRRLLLSTSGLDPATDDLGNVFAALIGRSPRVKLMWETSLEQLSAMRRTKFGLNHRVLRFETKSGEACRVTVDQLESWIEAICLQVNSCGVVEMVETEPNRWVVS